MAACVLCRRVPRIPYLQGLRKNFAQAQHFYGKPEDETNEQKGENGAFQQKEAGLQEGYRLFYNPSSSLSVWLWEVAEFHTDL
ncbi:FAST kinase domain-containing protein 5, mitochondrial-like [Lates japonicus]